MAPLLRLAFTVLASVTAVVSSASPPAGADPYPYPFTGVCPGFEDYPNASNPPRVLTPAESRHRYMHRPWQNTGLGHAMEVYNLVLRLSLHNNLTFVHTPLDLGHGPFAAEPELYFQFGRHPTEALPADKARLKSDKSGGGLTVRPFPTPEVDYHSHQSEAEPKFKALAATHSAARTWFEVPTPMVMADQDSDWSETGVWFRAKFESARTDHAFAAKHGLDRAIRVTAYDASAINVAVHIRRGDALMMGSGPHEDAFYIGTINDIVTAVRALEDEHRNVQSALGVGPLYAVPPIHVHIFTDGSKDRAGDMRYVDEKGRDADVVSKIKCKNKKNDARRGRCAVYMHLGLGAIETFHHFVHADILVQSISMFSNTAAIVSRNVKVFSRWNRSINSLPNCIPADPHGAGFLRSAPDLERFKRVWRAYRTCNRKRWEIEAPAGAQPPPPSPPAEKKKAKKAPKVETPPPAPPAPAARPAASAAAAAAAAEAEYERQLAAHDDF